MRRIVTGIVAACAVLCLGSGAYAQRDARDAADRGTRLDTDSFRNDMAQDRLKVPGTPLWLAPPAPTPAPAATKRKRTEKKQQ